MQTQIFKPLKKIHNTDYGCGTFKFQRPFDFIADNIICDRANPLQLRDPF